MPVRRRAQAPPEGHGRPRRRAEVRVDRTERFYRIDRGLRGRPKTLRELVGELEVSPTTVKRDLQYMRTRLHAPILWDAQARGYRFDRSSADMRRYALPGLWFNAAEAHALLTMEHLLTHLQPGLLGPHLRPLRERIHGLLDGRHSAAEVLKRLRVLPMATRAVAQGHFEAVASGVLERRRLRLVHHNRHSGQVLDREVSPQRLVYYRSNWYLDAWCHRREGLRSFGLDALRAVELLEASARTVPESELDRELGSGYGIFAGARTRRARLRFSAEAARWVAQEAWFREQEGRTDRQGRYLLTVPYSKDTELVMDILRYGEHVEVLGPKSLRDEVRARLGRALQTYA